jgi:nucleotide-binding universal stress UspA family protein
MDNINEILIAVELDNESEVIIEYGITLALMLNANVKCLHVSRPLSNRTTYKQEGFSSPEVNDTFEEIDLDSIDEILEEDTDILYAMVNNVKQRLDLDDFHIPIKVRADFAVPGILNEAEDIKTDLIIVGAHVDFKKRNHGITNLSKELIERSNKSVIVVPTSYGNRNLDHIGVFINFEINELSIIQDMIDVANNCDVQVSFIHILEKGESRTEAERNIEIYNKLFLHIGDSALIEFNILEGEITEALKMLNEKIKVDLIVLKLRKKNWNFLGLKNSIDHKIMSEITIPLFVWK